MQFVIASGGIGDSSCRSLDYWLFVVPQTESHERCLALHFQVANQKLERANADLTEAKCVLEEEKLQKEALLQRQVLDRNPENSEKLCIAISLSFRCEFFTHALFDESLIRVYA